MKHKKIIKKLLLACVAVCSLFIAVSNNGMKTVKGAQTDIGQTDTGYWNNGYFYEKLTYELISYNDNTDQGTYRIRYYIVHWGSANSYTYQVSPAELYVDNTYQGTFGDHVGEHISNETRFMGSADITVSAGQSHVFALKDNGGGITNINLSVNVWLPYRTFDVTYKDWNGTTLKTQSVQKYSDATAPSNPSRTGYTFTGWSSNGKRITSNTTITAQYTINYYTVRYLNYNGGLIQTQSVPYGSNATPPSNPTRTGYTFTGWSNDGTNITANRDITAQYKINNYNVSFNSMGGSAVATQSVTYQQKVTKPTDPTRSNYKFMGWYTNTAFTTAYNFDSTIDANHFTLYAKWDAYPVIAASNITIHDTQYSFNDWQKLKLKGVSSTDKEDGNLTSKIQITKDTVNLDVPGNYVINYQVTDSAGTTVNKEMKVTVLYNNPPVIKYKNYEFFEDEITREDWEEDFLMEAVTATDIEDGNMTSKVKVESDNVDPATPGDYQVVYSVKDQYNKTTKVTANVKIKYNYAPLITADDRKYMQNEFSNKEWKDHIMDGVEAIDVEDGNITDKIKVIEDDVDMETVGFYRVKYEVTDAYGKKHSKSIQIEIVLNVPPVIKAENKSFYEDEFTEEKWESEILKDITAYDSEDGDITDKIKIKKDNVNLSKAGSYEVIYSITDSGGKTTEKTIDVTVKKNHEPKLEILADNKRFVEGQYSIDEWKNKVRMENVSATDIEDNDITDKIIIIEDNVKPNIAGKYEVTYKVTDKFGKTIEKEIKVTVEENLAPVIHAVDKWLDVADNIDDKALLKDVIGFDDLDGNITEKIIIIENKVDPTKAGNYTVTYSLTDSLGKESSKTVTIHISDKGNKPTPPPVDPPVEPSDENAVIFDNGKNYGTVQLSKIMEASDLMDTPYDSVVFGIYAAEDILYKDTPILKKDNLVGIIQLDENHDGCGTVYHKGYYYVREIAVDEQYQISNEKYYFRYEY